ncbi:HalOD1 output domain-containing protein [Natrialbaceae archaeon A-chndr2]
MNTQGDIVFEIVDEIAKREGTDTRTLSPPLANVIDTDALETLCESTTANTDITVSFTYRSYRIDIHCPDSVEITPLESGREVICQDRSN